MIAKTRRSLLRASPIFACFALACGSSAAPAQSPSEPAPSIEAAAYIRLDRARFNQLAAEHFLPLFWREDTNQNGTLEPSELNVLWGFGESKHSAWISNGEGSAPNFSRLFTEKYEELVRSEKADASQTALSSGEQARRSLVLKELSQGSPTLIESDFQNSSEAEQRLVQHLVRAGELIETIYSKQTGAFGLESEIPADDLASQMLFFRNQGPWCVAPQTEADPSCNALANAKPQTFGLYPAALQSEKGFCDTLKAHAQGEQLIHQFYAVAAGDTPGSLKPVPYHEYYQKEMLEISSELKAAASTLGADEQAFKSYLSAAAQAFLDNQWEPADEAWAKMNVNNSKWYLRIGPDEVYFEPCNFKAGFHMSFARINQDSKRWQEKLGPVKAEMEQALASLAGAPYKARAVDFHLPDFIDIVLNAGDSRSAHGATIGQSLPNWGPVANEGRGRTVAMTNLYTDADSAAQQRSLASSLFCSATMEHFVSEQEPQIMSTVLHEAAHNLGPSHEYQVNGKTARQIFSGGMASTLEELKAQSAALYFTDWLAEKGLISQELAAHAHVRDVSWAFGHISRGMYEADGTKPKPYSQLAAIQLGWLIEQGAAKYQREQLAANAQDKGCVELDLKQFPKAAEKLMSEVAGILARGDVKRAEALKARYVDQPGETQALLSTIRERWLRAPKASFVYSIKLPE